MMSISVKLRTSKSQGLESSSKDVGGRHTSHTDVTDVAVHVYLYDDTPYADHIHATGRLCKLLDLGAFQLQLGKTQWPLDTELRNRGQLLFPVWICERGKDGGDTSL
jgi:hypothetical protein